MTELMNAHAQNLAQWIKLRDMPARYPQFSYQQLKVLFWKRSERAGLERCSQLVGRTLYVNAELFGLWLAKGLPEQQTK